MHRSTDSLPRGWRWFWWRALVFLAVFSMGLGALLAGVGLSDRPNVAEAELPTKVYYALGLFVLGGLDLGVPTGGPPDARLLLWVAFFLAPAITTTALVEAILRALRPWAWRQMRLRRHVVIVGCSRLALLYLHTLRQHEPGRRVLVVDRRADHPNLEVAARQYRAEILVADVGAEGVFETLRLKRARRAVLLTGNDLVNLDAASHITQLEPRLAGHIHVHVGDLPLLRQLESTVRERGWRIFNSHRTAARHLVATRLVPVFESTAATDTVVLAGFGRFGQTLLDELQDHAAGKFSSVLLVDREATRLALLFAEQVGFKDDYRHRVEDGDMRDPRTWQAIEPELRRAGHALVVILGSDDTSTNLRTAMALRDRYPDAYLVARCFDPSPFIEDLAHRHRIDIVSTSDLLADSIREWFEPQT